MFDATKQKSVASCIKILILHIWSMKVVVQILTNVVSYQKLQLGFREKTNEVRVQYVPSSK